MFFITGQDPSDSKAEVVNLHHTTYWKNVWMIFGLIPTILDLVSDALGKILVPNMKHCSLFKIFYVKI